MRVWNNTQRVRNHEDFYSGFYDFCIYFFPDICENKCSSGCYSKTYEANKNI